MARKDKQVDDEILAYNYLLFARIRLTDAIESNEFERASFWQPIYDGLYRFFHNHQYGPAIIYYQVRTRYLYAGSKNH